MVTVTWMAGWHGWFLKLRFGLRPTFLFQSDHIWILGVVRRFSRGIFQEYASPHICCKFNHMNTLHVF